MEEVYRNVYAQMSKAIAVVPIGLRLTAQASVSLHNCPIRLILQGDNLNYAETLGNDEYVSISFVLFAGGLTLIRK